ncbi:V-type proton ATPase subunit C-like [Artemia franciscana]|uniref:V-type proton ATPase subunit C-like n=1 Tax=Artemia franciscana TaxID=6661 RepID=UPI0032D9EEA0
MSEFWLVSVPGDKTPQQAFDKLNDVTNNQNGLSENYKFNIPDLKVGTLDQLVGLSDDLGKLDGFVEQVTKKLANYLGEVLENQRDKISENLLANGGSIPMLCSFISNLFQASYVVGISTRFTIFKARHYVAVFLENGH